MHCILYMLFFLLVIVASEPQLKLLHVIFSSGSLPLEIEHGGKGMEDDHMNSFRQMVECDGLDIMTNNEKMNMFNLGVLLRELYDDFLGDIHTPEVMRIRTTSDDSSMIAAELVDAGLWPPKGENVWNADLMWQPIPYKYVPMCMDTLMFGQLCPGFLLEKMKLLKDNRVLALTKPYESLFDQISSQVGFKVNTCTGVANLYHTLEKKAIHNKTLPSWVDGIFPDGDMLNLTMLKYDFDSWTLLQRRLNGGPLIKKVISDSIAYSTGSLTNERKLMIYSTDSAKIIGIMKALEVWNHTQIPEATSMLVFELLHDNTTSSHYLKMSYHTGIDHHIEIPLKVPGCAENCLLGNFAFLVSEVLPEDEDVLCGRTTSMLYAEDIEIYSIHTISGESNVSNNLFILCSIIFLGIFRAF